MFNPNRLWWKYRKTWELIKSIITKECRQERKIPHNFKFWVATKVFPCRSTSVCITLDLMFFSAPTNKENNWRTEVVEWIRLMPCGQRNACRKIPVHQLQRYVCLPKTWPVFSFADGTETSRGQSLVQSKPLAMELQDSPLLLAVQR